MKINEFIPSNGIYSKFDSLKEKLRIVLMKS